MGQGGDATSIIYMEVEGIKIAIQLAKDALRTAWQLAKFLLCSARDAKYKKTIGKTNSKNFAARANGQRTIPMKMDKDIYKQFCKLAEKAGILFTAYEPLRSGEKGSVHVVIMESQAATVQDILSQIKESKVRKEVKQGMEEETAKKQFDENNRAESMEEFAENVGATTDAETFDADMKERFGEDYDNIIEFPKQKSAGIDLDKVDNLADVIQFTEWKEKLEKDSPVEIKFVYDEENKKSQIVEQTESHVMLEGENLFGAQKGWQALWVPKDAIDPPLDKEPGKGGMRTVKLQKDETVIISDPMKDGMSTIVKAEELRYTMPRTEAQDMVAEEIKYQKTSTPPQPQSPEGEMDLKGRTFDSKEESGLDITLDKDTLGAFATEDAVRTRVPKTWGEHIRYLWLDKKDLKEVREGKTLATTLQADKKYDLYDKDGNVAESLTGKELVSTYYDRKNFIKKNTGIQENAGRNMMQVRGRGKKLK